MIIDKCECGECVFRADTVQWHCPPGLVVSNERARKFCPFCGSPLTDYMASLEEIRKVLEQFAKAVQCWLGEAAPYMRKVWDAYEAVIEAGDLERLADALGVERDAQAEFLLREELVYEARKARLNECRRTLYYIANGTNLGGLRNVLGERIRELEAEEDTNASDCSCADACPGS